MSRRSWIALAISLVALGLLPFACVARARALHASQPRLHIVQDMDNQGRFKSQQANPLFADGRAMRLPVAGTVARGRLLDERLERGLEQGTWVARVPLAVTPELLQRGRERYAIYCAPCHGLAGYGDGMIARRAERLQQGSWVPPASLHAEPAASRPPGHLFNTITQGIRNMPAYGAQIPLEDRWAIVGWVLTLQVSQHASLDDVPPDQRAGLN